MIAYLCFLIGSKLKGIGYSCAWTASITAIDPAGYSFWNRAPAGVFHKRRNDYGVTQTAIPYMQLRGGSSKGLYFRSCDVPRNAKTREAVLLAAMGGAGRRQIDGLGGADSLTSKVAIVGPSTRKDADLDYLFVQVVVGAGRTDTTPNCGNILAGVGAFAIESGLVSAGVTETRLTVHMVNSGKLCELVFNTPGGKVVYEGDTRIDGVPGTAAPIVCNYLDVAGSACGSLLPTGNRIDTVDGIELTCIDNGMPVVVMRASDLGIGGYESPDELNDNKALQQQLQSIRLQLGPQMGLGNVDGAAVPKMCMIAPAREGGLIATRTFIPYKCHSAIGVLGAVSVATACILPGSVARDLVSIPPGTVKQLCVEHPSGSFDLSLAIDETTQPLVVRKAGVIRTARLLSRGEVFIPSTVWNGDISA